MGEGSHVRSGGGVSGEECGRGLRRGVGEGSHVRSEGGVSCEEWGRGLR